MKTTFKIINYANDEVVRCMSGGAVFNDSKGLFIGMGLNKEKIHISLSDTSIMIKETDVQIYLTTKGKSVYIKQMPEGKIKVNLLVTKYINEKRGVSVDYLIDGDDALHSLKFEYKIIK